MRKRLTKAITILMIFFSLGGTVKACDSFQVFNHKEISRNYEWYKDQYNTGLYSEVNCGATVVSMCCKLKYQDLDLAVEDLRNNFYTEDSWWSTNDIMRVLDNYKVLNRKVVYKVPNQLKYTIDNGHVAIVCIDSTLMSEAQDDEDRTGIFYPPATGHFLVVKGYRVIDGELYYETYDPCSWGERFANGELKGKDRLYKASEIYEGSLAKWDYFIEVGV